MSLKGPKRGRFEGKPTTIVKAGDFLYDEPRRLHRTINTVPLKLLILRILEKGKPATVRP
jgi:hypothetical protein